MTETRDAVARAICPDAFEDWKRSYDYELRQSGDAAEAEKFANWSGGKRKADAFKDADAALASLKPGSRFTVDGVECVVVPVEPTPEMRAAGRDMLRDLSVEQLCTSDAADTYRAMLSACEEK